MITSLIKEIRSFLSSLIGYIAIAVFIASNLNAQNLTVCDSLQLDISFKKEISTENIIFEVKVKNNTKQNIYFDENNIQPTECVDTLGRRRIEILKLGFNHHDFHGTPLTEIISGKEFKTFVSLSTKNFYKYSFVFSFMTKTDFINLGHEFKEKIIKINDFFFSYKARNCTVEKYIKE